MPWGAVIMASKPVQLLAADVIHVAMGSSLPTSGMKEGDLFLLFHNLTLNIYDGHAWRTVNVSFASQRHSTSGTLGFAGVQMSGGPLFLSSGTPHEDLVLILGKTTGSYEIHAIVAVDGKPAVVPWGAAGALYSLRSQYQHLSHFPDHPVAPDWTVGGAKVVAPVVARLIHISMGASRPTRHPTDTEGDLYLYLHGSSTELYVHTGGSWRYVAQSSVTLRHSNTGTLGFVGTKMGSAPMTIAGGTIHTDLVLMPGSSANTYEVRQIIDLDGKTAVVPWEHPMVFPIGSQYRSILHFPDRGVTPDWTVGGAHVVAAGTAATGGTTPVDQGPLVQFSLNTGSIQNPKSGDVAVVIVGNTLKMTAFAVGAWQPGPEFVLPSGVSHPRSNSVIKWFGAAGNNAPPRQAMGANEGEWAIYLYANGEPGLSVRHSGRWLQVATRKQGWLPGGANVASYPPGHPMWVS